MTVYGTDKTKPEEVPALLAARKMVHPVLLDPESAYRGACGTPLYPIATILGPDGAVVWEGHADRSAFPKACEAELERLLAPNEGGPGPGKR